MNTEHEIQPGIRYIHTSEHRNGNHSKSQWTISEIEERDVFSLSYNSHWFLDNISWGLYLVDNTIKYLGLSANRNIRLFIGKFIDGTRSNTWHGYPANYMLNIQDKPDRQILAEWGNTGIMSFAKIRKILKAQPCNL